MDTKMSLEERLSAAVTARIESSMFNTTSAAPREPSALNLDALRAMMGTPALRPIPKIVFTPHVLEDSVERLFPASKHRSARIRKKLIKRHGGEFRKRPALWQVGSVIYAHPAHKATLAHHFSAATPSPISPAPAP